MNYDDPIGVTLESWKDLQILRWEPLISSFVDLRDQRGPRVEHRISQLAKKLLNKAKPGWRKVLNDWVDLAFLSSPADRGRKRVKLNNKIAALFVSCYWHLELNDDCAARNLINSARHDAGYVSNVPDCRGVPEVLSTKRPLDAPRPPAKRLKEGEYSQRVIKTEETLSLTHSPLPHLTAELSPDSASVLPPFVGEKCNFHTPQRRNQPWQTAFFPSPPGGSLSPLRGIRKAPAAPFLQLTLDPPALDLPTIGLPTPPPSSRKVSRSRTKTLVLSASSAPRLIFPPNPTNLARSRMKMNETALSSTEEIIDQSVSPDIDLWTPRDSIPNKLPMPMYPPIWAQSRQEVCESTSWFRSFQSGVYYCDGKAKGYLLGGYPSFRDTFWHGGKLIISHGGGKAGSIHQNKGRPLRVADDDQSAQDKSVRALLGSYHSKTPLVLLIDDKYAFFPYDLASKDVTYAILGVYLITHAWVEYDPSTSNAKRKVARHKFAFQWCEGQGEPWWITPKAEPTIETKIEDADTEMKDDTTTASESVGIIEMKIEAADTEMKDNTTTASENVGIIDPPGMPFGESQLFDCPITPAVLAQIDVGMQSLSDKCMEEYATTVDSSTSEPSDMSLSPASRLSDMSMSPDPTSKSEAQPPVHVMHLSSLDPLVLRQPSQHTVLKPRNIPDIFSCDPDGLVEAQCSMCAHISPQIYEPDWTCLQSGCAEFWKANSGEDFKPLAFHPGFMRLKENVRLSKEYEDIRPPIPTTHADDPTSAIFTRGWHCRGCGRLSCRFKWEAWECDSCHTELKVSMPVRPLSLFISISPGRRWIENDDQIHLSSEIQRAPSATFTYGDDGGWNGSLTTYILPHNSGKIHHIRGYKDDQEAGKIFDEYQEQASDGKLNFRRWPMRAHKCRGKLLTNYFSQNCGEPYHYVGGTENTIPFEKAASAVINAQSLIQKRISQALKRNEIFNEILSAAYMENQKMAFHSDAERGLGPVVAGLSLGSPAVMHFRLIKKPASQDRQVIALSVVLRHGDVLVMDGADIQNRYQHTVIPSNFRIAATARYINPGPKLMNVDVKPLILLGNDEFKSIV